MNSKIAMNTKMKMLLTGGFWVRIIIIVAAGIIFIQKDINFQVHLQSPLYDQEIEDEQPKEADEKTKSDEELSDVQSGSSRFSGLSASLFGIKKKRVNDFEVVSKKQIQLHEVSGDQVEAFIARFSNVAISERRKFGIPASIILANGLHQSAAGQTDYVKDANNYFNLQCDGSWDGMMKDFDGKCFRKYESAWAGFRGHSRFINDNYGSLKKYGTNDYKLWAKGLEDKGFGKQEGLAKKLITIIEKYDLDKYDQ